MITSATRTETQQHVLRLRSSETATSGRSTHSYGASIDIARIYGQECEKGREVLTQVLKELQEHKYLYLCPESVTIHVTVRAH